MINSELLTISPEIITQGGEQLQNACEQLRNAAAERDEAGAEFDAELVCMSSWYVQGPAGIAKTLECGNRLLTLDTCEIDRYYYAANYCVRTSGGLELGLCLVDIGMAKLRSDADALFCGGARIAIASGRLGVLTAMDAGSAQTLEALRDLSSTLVRWRIGADDVLNAIERIREAHGGALPEEASGALRALWEYFARLQREGGGSPYHERIEGLIESIVTEEDLC